MSRQRSHTRRATDEEHERFWLAAHRRRVRVFADTNDAELAVLVEISRRLLSPNPASNITGATE